MVAAGRVGWAVVASILWLFGIAIGQPLPGLAADPSPTPGPVVTARPSTCAERYPADGPAGVDLQLGCVVSELVGAYTGAGAGTGTEPPRISAWLGPMAAGVAGFAGLAVLLWAARRSAGRRLAPAAPTVWWSCPGCRSLSAAGITVCYSCGRPWEEGATEMRTDAEAPASQSFGRRHDGRQG